MQHHSEQQPSPRRLRLFSRAQARLATNEAERERRRRDRKRQAQGRYRQRLADRGVPELRELAEALLSAYVRTVSLDLDDETHVLTGEFLVTLRDAGFSIDEVKRKVRELRRRVLSDTAG